MKMTPGMYKIMGEGAFEYLAKAQELERKGIDVLHFEIGQPDFPTPSHIKEAAFEAINNNFTGYVDPMGILDLKETIRSEIENSRGFKPDLNQILVLPGAKPGIYFPMVALVDKGDEVIYPDPGFPTYASLIAYLGATGVPLSLKEENEFRLNPDDLIKKITPKTKLIILNSPQNPTGSVMTSEEISSIGKIASERGIYILSDEIYSKMLYDAEFSSVTVRDRCKENTILLDGFSKSYSMTGWRLGYIVAPSDLIEKMGLLLINSISCTSSFVQKAGIAALKGTQEPLKEMMVSFRERRDATVSGLNSIPGFTCLTPEGAFYTFPNIKKTGMSSREMADHLLYKAHVCALPGSAFGDSGEGYLRFSYATSVETINAAIERIKNSF